MTECPSRFTLVEWITGDLDPDLQAATGSHIEVCDSCRELVSKIKEEAGYFETRQEEHLQRLMDRVASEKEAGSSGGRHTRWSRRARTLGGIAAAAAVALVFFAVTRTEAPLQRGTEIRFKGDLSFEIIAKREENQFVVKEGARLMEGDALRFVITTGSDGFLSIFSVDSKGVVSHFYPGTDPKVDATPMRIERAGRQELPGSIILDDAIGDESFFFVFSTSDFNRDTILSKGLLGNRFDPTSMASGDETEESFETGAIRIVKEPKENP